MYPMLGDLRVEGHLLARGGFMIPAMGPSALPAATPRQAETLQRLQRGEIVDDIQSVLRDLVADRAELQRAITSSTTALPIRENLEAPARTLIPQDTPLRNRVPRIRGAGASSAWRQEVSLGGGYGVNTTVTTGAASATQTVGSTAGMAPGDTLYFATTAASRVVSSITSATVVVLASTISTTTSEVVTKIGVQPDGGVGAVRAFFAESGAPADHATLYASKSAAYKLLGSFFSVTGFAMAAGANYQDQYDHERRNAIKNTMLNEENALINGSSTDVKAPWGDGTNALGFDGLVNLITTANGTPVDQVQTAVGALTTAHIDAQLQRLWNQGADGVYMIMNAQEALSLAHLAEASGSIIRITQSAGDVIVGKHVSGYMHPLQGRPVDILVDRFLSPGIILYCADSLPDGSAAFDISVLPQVELPELAPNEQVQGYTAQPLAPAISAPQVYAGICTVFEVPRLKSAKHFAKSTGVTAI